MKNQLIIDKLNELVEVLLFIKTSVAKTDKEKIIYSFKAAAIKNGAKIISGLTHNIKSSQELIGLPGIGKGLKQRVDEIIMTGDLSELHDIKEDVLDKIHVYNSLLSLIGVGPVYARKLISEYNIKSINDLKQRVKNNQIIVSDQIKKGLQYFDLLERNIPRREISYIRLNMTKILHSYNPDYIIEFCGSYRRGKKTSNDIDVLISLPDLTEDKIGHQLKDIVKILKKHKLIIDDLTYQDPKTKYMGFLKYKDRPIRRIDIRLIPFKSLYSAVLYFTGSDMFNRMMRKVAKQEGYKLNEYGLFKREIKGDDVIYKEIEVDSEKDIFDKLELNYILPRKR